MAKTLYILLGSEGKNGEQRLVQIGRRAAVLAAVNTAPAALTQFQLGTFAFCRTVKRGEGGQAPEPSEQADVPQSVEMLDALNQATQRIRELEAALAEKTSAAPQQAPGDSASGETPVPTSPAESDATPPAPTGDDDGPRLPRKGR